VLMAFAARYAAEIEQREEASTSLQK